ncbi:MAG TPA: nucleotide exchange factor GrpE [Acidiferrobacterales bacterium]|nr:nucleotide exchange factor GrpE [Acidiferrobacterales bacterium]
MSPTNPAVPEDPNPAAEPAPEAPAVADIEVLKAELAAAQAQAAENLDKFVRAKAETENLRRRAETDVASAHKFAIERFALEMLAVKDSLERARTVDIKVQDASLEKMFEGIDLTLKLMDSIFQKFALTEINPAVGEKFDPERHQAMSTQDNAELPPNHVVMTLQKGYLLNNRLLRPALVIVARTPMEEPGPSA